MQSTLREITRQERLQSRFDSHAPHWHVVPFSTESWPECWWICDGATRVGLVVRGPDFAELVNFDPLHPAPDIAFTEPYHAPTQPGDRVTMAMWVGDAGTRSDQHDLQLIVEAHGVTATFTESWKDGRRASKCLTWKVDADFGYILHCEAEMSIPHLDEQPLNGIEEFCNFLPRGVTDDRPEFSRYPYVLWQHPSGRIVRWNQNNVGARALGALDLHDRRQIKNGGFIGFFGEKDRNSAIEILEVSPSATALSCPQMLDEHLLWSPLSVEIPAQDENGHYLYRAVYNLISVPPQVGDALTAQAGMLDMVLDRYDPELEAKHLWCASEYPQLPGEPKSLSFCPLSMGGVADFESKLNASSSFKGLVFPYLDDSDDAVSIVSDCAHSGKHSLRIRVAGESVLARGYAACLHVTEGQRYRLSAWMKTQLEGGEAALRAVEFQFSLSTVTAIHSCTPLSGDTDWQRVSLEFTPGEKAHVVEIRIEAEGHGAVWVDDILLEKVEA
jgi:hypothetical protein